MHTDPRNSYLESQILTATPQKLRLMLIEAAMGAARHAINSWEEKLDSDASIALMRCRDIVAELWAAVKLDDSELTRNVAGIYMFLFKTLAEAQLHRDQAKVRDAIKVLEIERETWRAVCKQMPNPPVPQTADRPQEITSSQAATVLGDRNTEEISSGGLSLDA